MIARDVRDFIIGRSKILKWMIYYPLLPTPSLLVTSWKPPASCKPPPQLPFQAYKPTSSRAKFAFGDSWPLVITFQIIITAPITHTIFLLYLFSLLPHQNNIVFCYFFFPFYSYLLAVITQDSVSSISKERGMHYSLVWKLDMWGTDFI